MNVIRAKVMSACESGMYHEPSMKRVAHAQLGGLNWRQITGYKFRGWYVTEKDIIVVHSTLIVVIKYLPLH